MESEWVDFKAVKSAVSMEMALGHYGIKLRRVNQTYLRGKCPLPTHTSKDAQSFGVHTEKNAWACQSDSCTKARAGKRGGNVLDFVSMMEDCSVRAAAGKLQNWFSVASGSKPERGIADPRGELVSGEGKSAAADPEDRNRQLEFALRGVDPDHPHIASRGISRESAATFGVGFFPGKGSMSGRVVIPICNGSGQLVAYAGRAINGAEPKYKFPGGFRKTLELFNQHRAITSQAEVVIVVEGFFDCMKVHQAGYPSVVALMGSTLSEMQERMLTSRFSRIVLLLDGDEPGREGARAIASRLVHRAFIKVVNVPDGKQPDQLSSEEIKVTLGSL